MMWNDVKVHCDKVVDEMSSRKDTHGKLTDHEKWSLDFHQEVLEIISEHSRLENEVYMMEEQISRLKSELGL